MRELRRYTTSGAVTPACPHGYHDTRATLDVVDAAAVKDEPSGDHWPHDDPRWPTACACGYVFVDTDEWQLCFAAEYERAETGERKTLPEWPAGAMWWRGDDGDPNGYFERLASPKHQARGGGPHLHVRTPGGDWNIDQKSSNGDGWDRTGEPPHVTARPSIRIYGKKGEPDRYHGWLTNGELIPC